MPTHSSSQWNEPYGSSFRPSTPQRQQPGRGNASFAQSFAPPSSPYLDYNFPQTLQHLAGPSARRHSHAAVGSRVSHDGSYVYQSLGSRDDGKSAKKKRSRRRRRNGTCDDDGIYFSGDSDVSGGSMADEASDYSSGSSDVSPKSTRRHTISSRHRREIQVNDLENDATSLSHEPGRSNPIAIAPPTRRESYLEQEALSARGDRVGAYFPFHEDPSLRIQRCHPFHSASDKARKQSITLAQTAALQTQSLHLHTTTTTTTALASSRAEHNGPLSVTATARRHSHYTTPSSRFVDVPTAVPVSPFDFSASSGVTWRTIKGFGTHSFKDSENSLSRMTSSSGLDKMAKQTPSRRSCDYDDLDPLDPIPEPRPKSCASLSPLSRPLSQAGISSYKPAPQVPAFSQKMGKYYPSVYENHQQRKLSEVGPDDEILYFSSDEEVSPGMTTTASNSQVHDTVGGMYSHHTGMFEVEESSMAFFGSVDHQSYASAPKNAIDDSSASNIPGMSMATSSSRQAAAQCHTYGLPLKSCGPESPRLTPLGSPGPVTPMDLDSPSFPMSGSASYFESNREQMPRTPIRDHRSRYQR